MGKRDTVLTIVTVVVLAVLFFYYSSKDTRTEGTVVKPTLAQRLNECRSFPNNSVNSVTETTRAFVNIPKDYYPNVQLQIDQQGASAGYVSNGGERGYALDAESRPGCWSYYFEFDGNGIVDITSKSGDASVPDYRIRFTVSSTTPE